MAQKPQYDVPIRRGHRGNLPIDLRFEGLVASQGTEIVRIRFSLNHDKEIDLPLTAEALAHLAQLPGPLHGRPPERMREGIAELRRLGVISDE